MVWVSILAKISIWIILVPLIFGLLLLKKLDRDSKLILVVVIAGTLPQVLRPFLTDSKLLDVLYNLYTPIEFFMYFLLIRSKVEHPKRKLVIDIIGLFYLISSVLFLSFFNIAESFLNEWAIVNNVLTVLMVCICLLEFYNSETMQIKLSEPFFWFLAGITCFASATAVFYSLWDLIQGSNDESFIFLNVIHHFFNILLYVFFTIGILKNISNPLKQPIGVR